MPSKLERPHTLPKSGAPCLVANLNSKVAVIVTHPWGPLGGNMQNNVVSATVLYFQQLGVTTLRMNFVGSQVSRGHYQVSQVEEAANYLVNGCHQSQSQSKTSNNNNHPPQPQPQPSRRGSPPPPPECILLVGYSYGSLIAASASANIPQCVGCVSIAPPFGVKHWLLLFNSTFHLQQSQRKPWLPKLLISGSQDNFTSESTFQSTIESFSQHHPTISTTTTGAILKDADHFFHRREAELMKVIGLWLMNVYGASLEGGLGRLKTADLQSFIVQENDKKPYTTTNNNNLAAHVMGSSSSSSSAAHVMNQQAGSNTPGDDNDKVSPSSRFSLGTCGADCTL
eukprot:CAMPEP_0195306222 /NCGR_PEP_ID=MMETSP0707-20130614/37077_1 /TAXON_ID=33640 /ORGANISM="Asterionellopsis glacialis, Strain CCMP134" /LENGTH=339 /DNA_ID=CAMNT_0040370433 /DNA_START=254 /DNA_END=1273 /DNA_ORIENTATION=+